jgi:hypothetical protein
MVGEEGGREEKKETIFLKYSFLPFLFTATDLRHGLRNRKNHKTQVILQTDSLSAELEML